jgi:hypothetical protein
MKEALVLKVPCTDTEIPNNARNPELRCVARETQIYDPREGPERQPVEEGSRTQSKALHMYHGLINLCSGGLARLRQNAGPNLIWHAVVGHDSIHAIALRPEDTSTQEHSYLWWIRNYSGGSGSRMSGGQRSSPVVKRPTGWSSWMMTFCPAHPFTVPARPCR